MQNRLLRPLTALATCLFLVVPARADPAHAMTDPPAASAEWVAGEIRKIDKSQGKLTIRHAPMTHLGMPAMTMVFRVQDPALLDQVKVGDAVRFQSERVNGGFTVTRLEPAR
jgi:Cu/Ag efflux protein CusF